MQIQKQRTPEHYLFYRMGTITHPAPDNQILFLNDLSVFCGSLPPREKGYQQGPGLRGTHPGF